MGAVLAAIQAVDPAGPPERTVPLPPSPEPWREQEATVPDTWALTPRVDLHPAPLLLEPPSAWPATHAAPGAPPGSARGDRRGGGRRWRGGGTVGTGPSWTRASSSDRDPATLPDRPVAPCAHPATRNRDPRNQRSDRQLDRPGAPYDRALSSQLEQDLVREHA